MGGWRWAVLRKLASGATVCRTAAGTSLRRRPALREAPLRHHGGGVLEGRQQGPPVAQTGIAAHRAAKPPNPDPRVKCGRTRERRPPVGTARNRAGQNNTTSKVFGGAERDETGPGRFAVRVAKLEAVIQIHDEWSGLLRGIANSTSTRARCRPFANWVLAIARWSSGKFGSHRSAPLRPLTPGACGGRRRSPGRASVGTADLRSAPVVEVNETRGSVDLCQVHFVLSSVYRSEPPGARQIFNGALVR